MKITKEAEAQNVKRIIAHSIQLACASSVNSVSKLTLEEKVKLGGWNVTASQTLASNAMFTVDFLREVEQQAFALHDNQCVALNVGLKHLSYFCGVLLAWLEKDVLTEGDLRKLISQDNSSSIKGYSYYFAYEHRNQTEKGNSTFVLKKDNRELWEVDFDYGFNLVFFMDSLRESDIEIKG